MFAAAAAPLTSIHRAFTRMHSERYEFANVLRGVASLSVVISHLALGYWLDPSTVAYFTGSSPDTSDVPPITWLLVQAPWNFGSFGVGLFFIISGFVIPFSLVAYDVRSFLIGRFFRIYPTFWVGVSISIGATFAAGKVFGTTPPFDFRNILSHMLAPLRPILDSRPIDGVVWTLEVELLFYFLCAFLARDMVDGRRRLFLVPFALFFVWAPSMVFVVDTPAGYEKLAHRAEFLALYPPMIILMFTGVAYNLYCRGKLSGVETVAWIATFFGLFCATWASGSLGFGWKPSIQRVIHLPSYALALACFFVAAAMRGWFRSTPVLDFFASISYSLYVVHQIAGFILLRLFAAWGLSGTPATLLAMSCVVGLASVLHKLVEAPTHRFGQAMARSLITGSRMLP